MIEYIHLRNFQAHKDLLIELDPCVTAITGDTDSGKSSIIRALYWLAFNKPSGIEKGGLRRGTKTTGIKLDIDGHSIVRKKGKDNLYLLDKSKYKSFGTKVPTPISEILNLQNCNFQLQGASPFWLSLSPGQLSKELNKIIDLGIADESIRIASSREKRAKTEISIIEERLADLENEYEQLGFLDEADAELSEIENLERDLGEIDARINEISQTVDSIESVRNDAERKFEKAKDAQKLLRIAGHLARNQKGIDSISECLQSIASISNQIENTNSELSEAEEELHAKLDKDGCPLCGQEWKG